MMTEDQLRTVAALGAAIRHDWVPASVVSILRAIADRDFADTCHAMVAIAIDETTQTPKRILANGPHWRARPGVKPVAPSPVQALSGRDKRPRCPVHGADYPAATCRACRSEWLAGRLPAGSRYDTESDPRRRTA